MIGPRPTRANRSARRLKRKKTRRRRRTKRRTKRKKKKRRLTPRSSTAQSLRFFSAGGSDVKNKNRDKKQNGDVLGISDSPASAHIPQATTDRGGHPEGIEVG